MIFESTEMCTFIVTIQVMMMVDGTLIIQGNLFFLIIIQVNRLKQNRNTIYKLKVLASSS